MINKKTATIFSVICILLLIFVALFPLVKKNWETNNNPNMSSTEFVPEFLTIEEKKSFRLEESTKVQVISRNPDGKIMVYKIINNNKDIVAPKNVGPVR